jgi:hypothetical protein
MANHRNHSYPPILRPFTRRRMVQSAPALLIGATAAPLFASSAPARTNMTAEIALGGVTYLYDSTDGVDLGKYVAPAPFNFVQDCITVSRADCPLTVMFRSDANDSRREVVFELSNARASPPNATARPDDLGSYSVIIKNQGTEVASIQVPKHFYYSRWRWQSAARPVVATVSNLISSGLLPKYSATRNVKPPAQRTYSPMTLAGITAQMGATGERDEIGPVTEQQGYYLVTGEGLATVIAQGEAAGTLPWHRRKNGAPINYDSEPNANWFWMNMGTPWYPNSGATGIVLDTGHMPALTYVPFLLTGDPYYLEELQFEATWNLGNMNPEYRNGAACLLRADQTRTFAWGLRALMQAAAVTPAIVPSWLLPQSYWQTKLENNRQHFISTWMKGGGINRSLHSATEINQKRIAFWQEDFLAFVLIWMVRAGFSAWQPIADWKVSSTLARSNGTSGWPRALVSFYWATVVGDHPAANWAEAFAMTNAAKPVMVDDPNVLSASINRAYVNYARAVLAANGGGPEFAWLDGQMAARGYPIYFKWSVVP